MQAKSQTKTEIRQSDSLGHRLRRLRSSLLKVRRQLESDIREVDAALASRENRFAAERACNPEVAGFQKCSGRTLPRSQQIVLQQSPAQPTSRAKIYL